MKKGIRGILITGCLLLLVALTVFVLAKNKVIFLNEWLVNEDKSTIGVDISAYQADVDMSRLKEQDIEFVYIKATEGSSHRDERFAENWAKAADAGLLSGAYHFFSFESSGKTQAENFIQTVGKDLTGHLLPVVDVEYYVGSGENVPVKDDVVRELTVFLQELEKTYGVRPVIYAQPDLHRELLEGDFDEYKLWMTSLYTPLRWSYDGDWYLWQYLNRGTLEGYSGGEQYIDLNVLNKDKSMEDLIVR